MRNLRGTAVLAAALVLGLAAPAVGAAQGSGMRCTGEPKVVLPISLTVDGERATGLYATPRQQAKGLVVFFHGYGHTEESWRHHLARVADQDGVLAVAMRYRGTTDEGRGWRVAEGAADSIAAARLLLDRCQPTGPTIAYGVSMGGNASGLAVAATRDLFDWWVDVEGAANVTETYHSARALSEATGNAYAAGAQADIEEEMGGTFEEQPAIYLERSIVTRAADIKASGVRGVVMVHGLADGLVPYDQSRELAEALRAHRVPVHFTTVATRPEGTDAGTTIDGYVYEHVPVPLESPFAGHGSEQDEDHRVIGLGFTRLRQLLGGQELAHAEEREL